MRERRFKLNGRPCFDTSLLSDSEKSEFVKGWKDAGGYMGDCDGNVSAPWCMPWLHGNALIENLPNSDLSVYQLGQAHWENCKDEIAKFLEREFREA